MPLPMRIAIETIASNAGFVADDSAPRSNQAVEEGRLANVRPSDNRDERSLRHGSAKKWESRPREPALNEVKGPIERSSTVPHTSCAENWLLLRLCACRFSACDFC